MINPAISSVSSVTSFIDIIERVFGFIWSIIKFLYFGGRSIIFLMGNIFRSVFDLLIGFFDYLIETFNGLSLYTGSFTIYIVYFMLFVMIVIVFNFIIRLFTGKYAIFNKKK